MNRLLEEILSLRAHPRGFWFIFWGELAERASYYGMRAVLARYLVSILGYSQNDGGAIVHGFIAACYLACLLGGFIGDRVLGRFKTILYFSPPYILGHIILGGFTDRPAMFLALTLLALGSGSIKPNTSTMMGQMYEEQKKAALLDRAFTYFYAAINIGAAASQLGLPWLRDVVAESRGEHEGYAAALMVPAALMVAAFFMFALGRKYYPKGQVQQPQRKTAEQKAEQRKTFARVGGLFAIISLFWFVYDDGATTWIYFAQNQMDLRLIGDWTITSDQVQGINSVCIIAFTPLFNVGWDLWKDLRQGRPVPDTRKMLIGFFILIACVATMAGAGYMSESHKVSVWWVCIATAVITLSELCISAVGLEFAYKQGTPTTKSIITGCFFLAIFAGDTLGGFFNEYYWGTLTPGDYFLVQVVIVVFAAFAFWAVARKFERGRSAQSETA
jgi:POT family proton-dependent oligopeptide transporter